MSYLNIMQKFIKLENQPIFMSYCIIVRGPAGVGKTTIAKKLTNLLRGVYISYDDIMRKNKIDLIEGDGISTENFIEANKIILAIIKQKDVVVLDGCFYREKQIEHLLRELKEKAYIFTLVADLKACLIRNEKRKNPMTKKAIIDVFKLVSKIDIGIKIQTDGKTIEETVETIMSKLSKEGIKNIG